MTFGQRIKKLRKEADLTQERVGELLSVSTQAISRWETDAAMPDINLLAPIANLFNVTTDYLLDVDIERKNERIKEILKKANKELCRNQDDRWNLAAEFLREGLRLYPDSWRLKSMLAFHLPVCRGSEDEIKKHCEEANRICEDIIANCPDRRLQYQAIDQICHLAEKLDNHERALELADMMPLMHQSRDFLLLGNLKGKAGINHIKDLIHSMYVGMDGLLCELARTANDSDMIQSFYTKSSLICEALYENDDFIKSGILGDSKSEWAILFAGAGDFNTAFQLLNEDLDRIIYISENKLHGFAYLSPGYLTKQVEEKDLAERNDEERFRVESYLICLEECYPDEFKKDARFARIKKRYEEFINKCR